MLPGLNTPHSSTAESAGKSLGDGRGHFTARTSDPSFCLTLIPLVLGYSYKA